MYRWEPATTDGRSLSLVDTAEPRIAVGLIGPKSPADMASDWEAFVRTAPLRYERLRSYDDREAAGRSLCAYLRIPMPPLPFT